jgi:CspA family cold shock protein
MKGKVKFYKEDKGYGFIISDQNEEIFFHKSGLQDAVVQGDQVDFEVEQGKKGIIAVNVTKQ